MRLFIRRYRIAGCVAAVLSLAPAMASAGTGPADPEWPNTDFSRSAVELSEIVSGGPPRDGIPSIDAPRFVSAGEAAATLDEAEPVIGVAIDGDARAYPLRILIWHEIVNDTVGGVPLVVTYCPLCNSAVVFRRRVADRLLDFGTTGKLRNSDLVMYDRQTESWWQQFTGEAIVGEMTGVQLKSVPARLEAFALFRERHPAGKVLVPTDPAARPYGRNPYVGYDSRAAPYPLFRGELPGGINPMARVVAFSVEGEPHAITLDLLRRKERIEIGDTVIAWSRGQSSALDSARIGEGRDVGNVVAQRRIDGSVEDIVYDVTFAFVFNAFYPERKIRTD